MGIRSLSEPSRGTVGKIRIRATTITDFDPTEVIIPNKAFVAERLINFIRSPTPLTQVVIRLGVFCWLRPG
ncbi:mechanosensitive ion channel domain-containing protein [Klebsiella pneumoniae]